MVSLVAGAVLACLQMSAFGAPISTTMDVNANPVTIQVGASATITGTLTPNTGEVNCGGGRFQYRINGGGWTGLEPGGVWLDVAVNQFSDTFNTNLISVIPGDVVEFRGDYV